MRKVEPLARALVGKQAWMTGLRRVETAARANAPIAHLDVGRGIVKVNPLAPWTDDDIAGYKRDHELLEHPLASQGYPSIGCWPCTRSVHEGDNPRAGRWAGRGKDEVRSARLARAVNRHDFQVEDNTNASDRLSSLSARSRVDPSPP